jgi:L-asparaginase II
MRGVWVEATRGGAVESRHRVHVAVVDEGGLRAYAGDPEFRTFARSSVKPIQALPLVDEGGVEALGLTDAELALCCASHGGEPFHIEAARSILAKAGADESALACGPRWPNHEPSARALRASGVEPGAIHNECSGKHGGMLAFARMRGWSLEGYHRPDHPVQRRMLEEVSRWTEVPADRIGMGVDGCGVVTFAVPLTSLAGAFARLAAAAHRGEAGPARVLGAMARHPEYVGGTDRLCTEIVRATGGRILAKIGAEGVYCGWIPEAGLGVALKVEDGSQRASGPALTAVLRELGLLTAEEYERLRRFARPELKNTRGEVVGELRVDVALEVAGG